MNSKAALALLLLLAAPQYTREESFKKASPNYEWSFPRDHYAHPGYKTEWWYFTGHLEETGSDEYGFAYQFTIFRLALAPEEPDFDSAWATNSLIMAHAAITDISARRHLFSESLYRAVPFLGGFTSPPDPVLAWTRGPAGTDARWQLSLNEAGGFDFNAADETQDFSFALSTAPLKPRVFQGPNGYSPKSASQDSASLYYSYTRLATEGQLELDGRVLQVEGQSWMDKEFSTTLLTEGQTGWDWFSLQLDSGEDLMLFQLRREDGGIDFAHATLISPQGTPAYLNSRDWTLTVTRRWRSPASGAGYPIEWALSLPSRTLALRAVVEDQENRSGRLPNLTYWEGAVEASDPAGRKVGRGFAELTGYAPAAEGDPFAAKPTNR